MTKEQLQLKSAEYTQKLYMQLAAVFDEDCENKVDVDDFDSDDNSSAFIHALATLAPGMLFRRITGMDVDSLEFNYHANRLIMQFSEMTEEAVLLNPDDKEGE